MLKLKEFLNAANDTVTITQNSRNILTIHEDALEDADKLINSQLLNFNVETIDARDHRLYVELADGIIV